MPTKASAKKRTQSTVSGKTRDGVKKTHELKMKIRNAAQVVLDNIKASKAGRPPSYHPGFDHLAQQMIIINNTTANFADTFGASDSAIEQWMRDHPSFLRAIQRGKERADERVEKALIHRAMGYSHKSEKIFMNRDGRIVRARTVEQYPPDTKAAEVWLYNRRPDRWRARVDNGAGDDDASKATPTKVEINFKDARKK